MKTIFLKSAFVATGLLLGLAGCIKKNDPIIPQPINIDPVIKCSLSGSGTIERCPADSNLWFINNSYAGSGPITGPSTLLVPLNLPQAFKVNALTVKFKYSLTSDSTKLNCWFCGTPPVPYGKNIRLCDIQRDSNVVIVMKPVIYLYPQKKTKVSVDLRYKGQLTVTYPEYNENIHGWQVLANSDGSLINLADNTSHQYLFWEGSPSKPYNFNMNEGFCVKGSETLNFLKKTLPKLGLCPKEYNDMIVFWLPKMMNNPYNLIHFAQEEYTNSAPLLVTPKPDKTIRVFMAYQPCDAFIKTQEPLILTPQRKGFTLVEWGGVELSKPSGPFNLSL